MPDVKIPAPGGEVPAYPANPGGDGPFPGVVWAMTKLVRPWRRRAMVACTSSSHGAHGRWRWLRLRRALYQCRVTWVRRARTARPLPGTAY